MAYPRAFRALQHREFRILWATFIVGQTGFWVSNVALQLQVVRLNGADPSKQAVLAFANFIPLFLLSPLSGLLADRFERRNVIVASQGALGLVAAGMATIGAAGVESLDLIYVMALALGIAMAVGAPAIQALTANVVPPVDLSSAVSLQSAGQNLSRVVGPAVSVPIVLIGGPQGAFAVFAVMALVTVFLLIRITGESRTLEEGEVGGGLARQLWRGLVHTAERPPALAMLSMVAVSGFFGASYSTIIPVFAVRVLHQGSTGFFAIVSTIGIGAIIGALLSGLSRGGVGLTVPSLTMLGLGVTLALIGVSSAYYTVLLLSGAFGGLFFALMAMLGTSLQRLVADWSRGRVMGLYNLCWGGLFPIGALALGGVASLIGSGRALSLFGVVVAVYAVVIVAVLGRRQPVLREAGGDRIVATSTPEAPALDLATDSSASSKS